MAAVERGNSGIYLITDDQPSSVREWLPAYVRWLNVALPPHVSVEDAIANAVYYGTRMHGVSYAT
ncbi:MAG: hypothetical protein PUP93_07615 [Rhizonema sp. NSF051]|nr:hypothetical protein [Rhizonema sp. NSF051]